jgi:hypothetical protein
MSKRTIALERRSVAQVHMNIIYKVLQVALGVASVTRIRRALGRFFCIHQRQPWTPVHSNGLHIVVARTSGPLQYPSSYMRCT